MTEPNEAPTLQMRAARAVRESSPPTVVEYVVGVGLLVFGGWQAIQVAPNWWLVGAPAVVGLYLVAPVRAERLWREAREVLPFLSPPEE